MDVVAQVVVALATLALAWGTFVMARATRAMAESAGSQVEAAGQEIKAGWAQVSASREQAELTRLALLGSVRPVLAEVPRGIFKQREDLFLGAGVTAYVEDLGDLSVSAGSQTTLPWFSVPLRNVGAGVAFVRGAHVEGGGGWSDLEWVVTWSRGVVPPGERVRMTFAHRPDFGWPAEWIDRKPDAFDLVVAYGDLADQNWRVHASVLPRPDGVWAVRQVLLYRKDESKPFAASGPSF